MTGRRLALSRAQILSFRRTVQALDVRLPWGPNSLRHAAWAGLQDSMPRAALLSIHARVHATKADAWEDPSLVQVWGPRFSAYVVAAADVAPFTLGRLPDEGPTRRKMEDIAARLHSYLGGRTMTYSEAGRGMGEQPNSLRYAAPTGTVLIRWEGARQPTIWTVPAPGIDAWAARLELARRYLHFFGPTTAAAFSDWAGIKPPRAIAAFDALAESLTPVHTPVGDGWILSPDESAFRAAKGTGGPARLLPSGDTYFLLQGVDRELLVSDPHLRSLLWTSRVWPGAVLLGGEIVGTWRRAESKVTIEAWRKLSAKELTAVDAEARSLPLPGLRAPISVQWVSG